MRDAHAGLARALVRTFHSQISSFLRREKVRRPARSKVSCRWRCRSIYHIMVGQPLKSSDTNERTESPKIKDIFLSYSFRPKLEKDTFKNIKFQNNSENTAIIIQGPVKNYENFVIETIKIYSKIFPEALLVLSTWEDEVNKSFLNNIKNFNKFHLIQNIKPITKMNSDENNAIGKPCFRIKW